MTVIEVIRYAMGLPLLSRKAPPAAEANLRDIASVSGRSVLQEDNVTAAELKALLAAAQSGDAGARFRAGKVFYRGVAVPCDHAEAFKWLTLAAESGDPGMVQDRALILQGMAIENIAEGRRRVAVYKGEPEPPPMGLRADEVREPALTVGAPAADAAIAPVLFIKPDAMADAPLPTEVRRVWVLALAVVLVLLMGGGVWLAFRETTRSQTASFVTTDGRTAGPWKPAASYPAPKEEPAGAEYPNLGAMKLAAEKGEARAQFLLGLAYAKGDGVPQDFTNAVIWYQKAAAQGEANAQNNLGVCYVQGTGVPLDPVAAYKWFSVAAKSGLKGVALNRDQLALMLTGSQLAEAVRQAQAFVPSRGASTVP